MPTRRGRRGRRRGAYLALSAGLLVLLVVGYFLTQRREEKPIILYVNQGNGIVDGSNFGEMLSFASSHGFNTIFFQIFREGSLLFTPDQLGLFVNRTHAQHLTIFYALYITNSSQIIPGTIMGLGEDGISLDMSSLSLGVQETLLGELGPCHCQTALTTINLESPLKPDLLVLETYGPSLQQYIRHGTIASVGVFTTTSEADYQRQFQYALSNSDGVMVFDYAGLMKSGY